MLNLDLQWISVFIQQNTLLFPSQNNDMFISFSSAAGAPFSFWGSCHGAFPAPPWVHLLWWRRLAAGARELQGLVLSAPTVSRFQRVPESASGPVCWPPPAEAPPGFQRFLRFYGAPSWPPPCALHPQSPPQIWCRPCILCMTSKGGGASPGLLHPRNGRSQSCGLPKTVWPSPHWNLWSALCSQTHWTAACTKQWSSLQSPTRGWRCGTTGRTGCLKWSLVALIIRSPFFLMRKDWWFGKFDPTVQQWSLQV